MEALAEACSLPASHDGWQPFAFLDLQLHTPVAASFSTGPSAWGLRLHTAFFSLWVYQHGSPPLPIRTSVIAGQGPLCSSMASSEFTSELYLQRPAFQIRPYS